MKAIILSAMLFLGATIAGQAQLKFQAGPEIGYALSTLPARYVAANETGSHIHINSSLFNPMLGFKANLLLGEHWMLGASLQYQLAGTLDRTEVQGIKSTGAAYHSVEESKSRYHKACLPLTINYSFQVGKFRPYIGIGYRAGVMIYALRRESSFSIDPATNAQFGSRNRDFLPLQRSFPSIYHPRRVNQLMVCLGTQIGERLQLSMNAAIGMAKYYGLWEEDHAGQYVNGDIYFTAGYSIWNRQLKRTTLSSAVRLP